MENAWGGTHLLKPLNLHVVLPVLIKMFLALMTAV
jgi:hypothetical protein